MLRFAMISEWHAHAKGYARSLQAMPEAEIAVVYDEDPERGQEWATELGVPFEADLAKIYTMLGETELAIEMIERLTAAPWVLSVNTLRQDPTWDPIRDDPSFQALLEKHEEVRN